MATRRVTDDFIDQTLIALSQQLKSLRVARGLRLAELAAMTGLSETYLYRLEEGERAPSLPALLRLAEAHGVSPGELLGRDDEPARVANHHAMATWEGTEQEGEGRMWTTASAVARFDRESRLGGDAGPPGMSSPEQSIGMALAACFSMSLAQQLAAAGFEAERIETRAQVKLAVSADSVAIKGIQLITAAEVPGISTARLETLAQRTSKTCVVARALAAVPVTLELEHVDAAG